MKKAIVFGAGGFIGHHLVKKLKMENRYVIGVDQKYPEFESTVADVFHLGDLRNEDFMRSIFPDKVDELYQLAADMGGAGYVFTGLHDAEIMQNSVMINLNTVKIATERKVGSVFFASSACVYPSFNQVSSENPICSENSAYPALPDSEYGWEKLFSERLYLSAHKNHQLNVKIARMHNVYGELSVWKDGKEKAPSALCRKIALAKEIDDIEIWGDGNQTRSFLYIDDCLNAILRLMNSPFVGPYNIGSEEMVSIKELVKMIANYAQKEIGIHSIEGPIGVRGRCSDNRFINQDLNWEPSISLEEGIRKLYVWIEQQIKLVKN